MHWSDLASFLKTTAEQLHIPAGFCTVTQAHRTLFSCACGADKDALEKSRGASYWIYSATKPICAAAAMQMVEAGIFRLDEPVSRYLPEYANLRVYDAQKASHPVSDPLLIEHLLTMQGGFDYDLRPPAVQKLLQQKNAAADTIHIAAAFAEKPLQFEPGTHFRYSLCLDVLGAVMEAASGIRLGRWMREKLFLPLGMLHTGFSPNEKAPPLAPQFRQQPDGSITLEILGGVKAVFRPREGLDLAAWFAERDRKAAAHAAERLAKSQEKGYVEKGNKDEPFRYHIAKVEEEDDSLQEDPVLTNEDLVLGIRPEFLNITNEAPLKGEIYGAMPTGMESTIKVYVNGFLLTGVVFGSSLFTIGQQHSVSFTGHHIMLFDRQSGDCIALGSLETL